MLGGRLRFSVVVASAPAALAAQGCSSVRFEDDDGAGGNDVAAAAQVGVTSAAATTGPSSSSTGSGPREIELAMIVPEGAESDAMVVAVHHADGTVVNAWWWVDAPARLSVVDGDLVTFIARYGESAVYPQSVASYRVTPGVSRIERRFALPAPAKPNCPTETMPLTLLFPPVPGASWAQAKTSVQGFGTIPHIPGDLGFDVVTCAGTPSFDLLVDVMDGSGVPVTARLFRGVAFQSRVPVAIDLTFPPPSLHPIRFDIDAPSDALDSGCSAGWRSSDVGSDPLAQELHTHYTSGSSVGADGLCEAWPYDFGGGRYDRFASVELPPRDAACWRSASFTSRGGPGDPVHFAATALAEISPDAAKASMLVLEDGDLGDVVVLEHHVGSTSWSLAEDPHQLAWPPVIPAFPAFLPRGFTPNGSPGGARVDHREVDAVSGYAAHLATAPVLDQQTFVARTVVTDCD